MQIKSAYETREQWLNAFLRLAAPHFAALGAPIPANCRVSIGFPSAGYRSKVIGECWSNAASADNHYEIFLNPRNETDARIADILTHEACHAALGIAEGHGKRFRALASGLGLTGKMTATTAGPDWFAWAAPILTQLGPMPYGALTGAMKPPRKKKPTHGIKVECPACGWLARVNAKWIEPHSHLNCPAPECGTEMQIG